MKNNSSLSNETALSVQNNKTIAVKNESVPTYGQTQNQNQPKKAKKNTAANILIILSVLIVLALGAFFGYKLYTIKVSENILSDLRGTWVYDTASENAGYVAFFGNDDVVVDGTAYSVSATKKQLTFKREDKTVPVSYILKNDQLLFSLTVENELFESCNMTISNTDAGVLLYRINDSYTLDTTLIQKAYIKQFPQYASLLSSLDSIIDWGAMIEDYQDGEFDFNNISDYLPEVENAEDLQDYLDAFGTIYNGAASGSDTPADFDFSSVVGDFLSDYIGQFGDDAGNYVNDSLDGTDTEALAEGLYEAWQFFEAATEEDSDFGEFIDNLFSW